MKDKVDFSLVKALLKKQWIERTYPYKRGNLDIVGVLLRLVIVAAFVTVFALFFGKFLDIYFAIKTDNALNVHARLVEMLTLLFTVLIVFMTVGASSQVNREIFGADDVKIFSAMPVPAKSLYVAKLISIYFSQFIFAVLVVLTVNLTVAAHAEVGATYYVVTALTCILLPLISIAIASILALPFNMLKQLLKDHFVINFVIITAITGVLFYGYTVLLSALKELLLGDSLRYFFNEQVMNAIASTCKWLYPAKWIANLLVGEELLISGIGIALTLAVCLALSMIIIRKILISVLQSRTSGSNRFIKRQGKMAKQTGNFWSLVKKEFLIIFRTPSYMFSYLSVAVIMPIMVYSCMTIGSSLVERLVGLNCDLELGLFLTLLFGALTNVFCATNISRDGAMFYSVKALPLSYKKVFFSKVLMCMSVTTLSQLVSAILLLATGYATWYIALMLFVVGSAFSFVHICVATRYDFNHAHFSTEEDGEIKETSGVVSAIIVLGLLISFLVGGGVFVSRILLLLRELNYAYVSYLIAGGAAIVASALAYLYFIRRLKQKYYEFDGGGI